MAKHVHLEIDIVSDVMCPWCLIGYGQLTKALRELEGEIEAQLRCLGCGFVPEPMAKCAVCTASPISTTWLRPLKCDHCSHLTRWKLSHAEPRRCLALDASLAPSR